MDPRAALSLLARLRKGAGAFAVDTSFRLMAGAGRLHPLARPERQGVSVVRDVPYRPTGRSEHLLDVYRPSHDGRQPLPVVLYVHGGGFRILSKDTHWIMGLGFSRRGFLVFNISYRLAPEHPFPAAVEDACAAYEWVLGHASAYGGDVSRLVLAGESAGANLVTALALASSYRRDEPWARRVFDSGVQPCAVLAACGLFQVSDTARFKRRKRRLPAFIADRLEEVEEAYLGGVDLATPALDLANPLLVLERGERPARPLPPFFLPVGTRDPLLDDTRRMHAALGKLGVRAEARYYPGELHAFNALVFRRQARACWSHSFRFLDEHMPPLRAYQQQA